MTEQLHCEKSMGVGALHELLATTNKSLLKGSTFAYFQ